MRFPWKHYLLSLFIFLIAQNVLWSSTDRYRCMWRDNPATSMLLGWEQVSGHSPVIYYDVVDWGTDVASYNFRKTADKKNWAKGMHNHFARLTDLQPSTVYYFVIKDNESLSPLMSFKTAPGNPNEQLSIIAGGDSRNYRKARCNANKLVAKLRPHCVMFGGDMTGGDIERQWKGWLDDWQNTIGADGRLTPIIVARGNHEASNQSLIDLFDVKSKNIYYGLTLGGNLLRVYTLNSLIATGGDQKIWLENDLKENENVQWKFAQYHFAIRPHTAAKSERNNQMRHWASLFHQYGLDLACESDAHVVKTTYPLRPSTDRGSDEGFIRDDQNGTVYVGEGCWGAPLRRNNDDKSWTRASGSFNQFKWIFVNQEKIEIRTIKTDNADEVAAVHTNDIFSIPNELDIWKPKTGEVLTIFNQQMLANFEDTPPPPVQKKKVKTAKLPSTFLSKENKYAGTKKKEPMPVVARTTDIYDFIANIDKEAVTINWATRNEMKDLLFEVERSFDGQSYKTIAVVQGNGNQQNFYKVEDMDERSLNGLAPAYRLKQILANGNELVYQAKVKMRINDQFKSLSTDPRTGQLQFKYKLEKPADVSVRLFDDERQEIIQSDFRNLDAGSFLQSIDVSMMPEGNYILIIEANETVIEKYQVVKRI